MASAKTRTGRTSLSEVAKHLVLPSDIATTGWPGVRDKLSHLGIGFDPWQQGLARAVLAKRANGKYAAGVGGVVISIPRQVGKTYTVGAIAFALCLIYPRLKVIWTAHHSNTADETYDAMAEMARRQRIAPFIRAVRQGSGKQSIHFKNRSRIEFGAREHGFGRGKQKVGILVLDEAQILSERAMENLVPTTNQAENPLIFLMGTPPRAGIDNGEVFRNRRREALAGESDDMVYVEFSARRPVDVSTWKQGQVGDWAAVAEANPSFPLRTPKAAILRMRKLLPSPESFRYEALGIWDEDGADSVISKHRWAELEVDEAPNGVLSYGVAFSFDDTRVSVGGAIKSEDRVHVELIDAHNGRRDDGVSELVRWFCDDPDSPERWRKAAQIALCGRAGATVLYEALRARGVPAKVLLLVSTSQYTTGCAMFLDAVRDGTLSHLSGQPPLDDCVTSAEKKPRGQDGAWGWKAPDGHDETPVEAVTVALWAAKTSKRKPGRKAVVDF